MLAYEVARGGFLDEHVRKIRALYRTRRDAMLAAMKLYFPPEVQWTYPAGGLFLWVTLPPRLDAAELLHVSLVERVAFVPGSHFFPRLTCEQHASSQLFERRAAEDRRGDSKAGLRPQAHAGFGKQASASSVRRCRRGASRFLSLGVLVSLSFSIL